MTWNFEWGVISSNPTSTIEMGSRDVVLGAYRFRKLGMVTIYLNESYTRISKEGHKHNIKDIKSNSFDIFNPTTWKNYLRKATLAFLPNSIPSKLLRTHHRQSTFIYSWSRIRKNKDIIHEALNLIGIW